MYLKCSLIKRVTQLHHANSVATACQFIRSRALLSRGSVKRLGFAQTPQDSDEADRRYSIWFDVFLDSVDIHSRANRANVYGPVQFVFNLNIINKNSTGRIWVTKKNPTKWAGKPYKERWFQDKEDLDENFVKGRFDQRVVLRHCGGELPFGKHLKKIILDDPGRLPNKNGDFYSMPLVHYVLLSKMQESLYPSSDTNALIHLPVKIIGGIVPNFLLQCLTQKSNKRLQRSVKKPHFSPAPEARTLGRKATRVALHQ